MIRPWRRENERLPGYTKRFQSSQEVMESHLDGCIEPPKVQMKVYHSTDGYRDVQNQSIQSAHELSVHRECG
jgi:hypothetical protein